MTRIQLSYLYSFINLPYSENYEKVSELKKLLILELKFANDTFLEIFGKRWTKNDILTFFETEIQTSFDYSLFIQDYPWIKDLENIENIQYNSDILKVDFSDERFKQFAQTESLSIEDNFLMVFRQRVQHQEDELAVALLLYKKCFPLTFQHRLDNEACSILTNRFNEIIVLGQAQRKKELQNKALFFKSQHFFSLMQEVANENIKILDLNIDAFYHVVDSYNQILLERVIDYQKELNHSISNITYLNMLLDSSKNKKVKKEVVKKLESEESEINIRKTFFILVILALILVWMFYPTRNTNNSTPSKQKDYSKIHQIIQDFENQRKKHEY